MGKDATDLRPQNEGIATSNLEKGNKGLFPKTQSNKWVMTWNNYPEDVFATLSKNLATKCDKWVFGLEEGKQGTKHVQGGFILSAKTRITTLWKMLGWKGEGDAPCWLKPMKGKWYDQKYCLKDGSVISNDKFFLERKRKMRPIIENLFGWQKHVDNRIQMEADGRTIIYVVQDYAKGKTEMCRYLCSKYGAVILDGEKRHVLAQVENNKKSDIFIYNQTADGGCIPWDAMESIKDGLFSSHFGTKNNGMVIIEHYVHLVIFSNKSLESALRGSKIDKNRFIEIK